MSYQAFRIALNKFKKDTSNNESEHHKNSHSGLIFSFLLVGLIIIAVFKNPSVTESKELVKVTMLEYIDEKLSEKVNEADNGIEGFSAMAGRALAPLLIDKFVKIDVSDYILFSTFTVSLPFDNEKPKEKSGIIVFGKVLAF